MYINTYRKLSHALIVLCFHETAQKNCWTAELHWLLKVLLAKAAQGYIYYFIVAVNIKKKVCFSVFSYNVSFNASYFTNKAPPQSKKSCIYACKNCTLIYLYVISPGHWIWENIGRKLSTFSYFLKDSMRIHKSLHQFCCFSVYFNSHHYCSFPVDSQLV